MKKIFLVAALGAAVLSSCSKAGLENVSDTQDNAISFSAYTGQTVTKGSAAIASTVEASGVGVFAFYQPAVNSVSQKFIVSKFPIPDFMYNQKVSKNASSDWEYSPLKYWPNNESDLVSFFAYAPYKPETTFEDLGIKSNAGSGITKTWTIPSEVADQVDELWAAPQLNLSKTTVNASIAGKVAFEFKHVLSKVQLSAQVMTDVTGTTPTGWSDANTTISIESVSFADMYDTYKCKYTIDTTTPSETFSGSGKQVITLSESNGDFANNTSAAWDISSNTDKHFVKFNKTNDFMFVAPQDFATQDAVVTFTYTVKTIDANLPTGFSEVTNVGKLKMSDLVAKFESGKAYNLKFLIGMTSVKVSVSISNDWDDSAIVDSAIIEVPVNNH